MPGGREQNRYSLLQGFYAGHPWYYYRPGEYASVSVFGRANEPYPPEPLYLHGNGRCRGQFPYFRISDLQ